MSPSFTRRLETKIPAAILACGLIVVCTWSISWTSPDPVIAAHIWMQIIVTLGIASIFMFGVQNTQPINLWVGLFLLVAMVSLFFSTYRPPSLGLVLNKRWIFSPATFGFYTILLGVAWYAMIVATFTPATVRWLMDAICIIALANVLFLFMQAFGYDPINATTTAPTGLTPNQNHASALLAFCAPAFLRGKWRWALPLLVPAICITKSVGGVVALGAGTAFYLTLFYSWQWGVSVSVIGVLLYSQAVDPIYKDNVRLEMWGIGWEKFKLFPWLGHGPGQWQTALHEIYFVKQGTETWHARAHNEYIQGVVEMGIPFLIVVAGYLVDIFKRIKRHALLPLTALVIILTNSLVNFPFHIPATGIIAVTWMAMLEVQLKET